MIEAGRRLISRIEQRFQPRSEIELSLHDMPARPLYRYEEKEQEKWRHWVGEFLSRYEHATDEEKKPAKDFFAREQDTVRGGAILEMIAVHGSSWANPDIPKEVMALLRPTENESVEKHPQNEMPALVHRVAARHLKRSIQDIIYERMAQKEMPQNEDFGMTILRRMLKGEVGRPHDPKFTEKVLEKYKGNKRAQKLLRKIHRRFHEWSQKQEKRLN